MPVTEIGDPRLQALFGASDPRDAGVRPAVRLPRKGLPPVALAGIALVFAVLLFMVLNQRRTSQAVPSVQVHADSPGSAWAAPPPLYFPPEPAVRTEPAVAEEQQRPMREPLPAPAPVPLREPAPVQTVYVPQPAPPAAPQPAPPPRLSAGAPLVIDTGAGSSGTDSAAKGGTQLRSAGPSVIRMRASALANRSFTVTQGTLIQAVLETGFDSTRPGFARAVVSRDVRSFDGGKVLIPRGSKLVGEYRSQVAQGQNRAVIIWTRLIRPDGMTIAMDSPAVDTLGRGGVPAKVNTHFFARLGDALLQTTIGIGSTLAQQRMAGPVVVLSGNATAAAGQMAPVSNYVPTLTVPAGKSISVFVAHDLDFSIAGERK
jgi:type IV secretion system protein VirB10